MPAGGGPPLLHRHAPFEVYRVESGTLAIYVEGDDGMIERRETGPGGVVAIPGGRAHTVRNESGAEARAYVVFAPGAPMERFVRAAGALGDAGVDAVLALAAEHGVELTGPVPA
jgi:mannose-6-phosphate isomerase-like protein (cupin superfamily)